MHRIIRRVAQRRPDMRQRVRREGDELHLAVAGRGDGGHTVRAGAEAPVGGGRQRAQARVVIEPTEIGETRCDVTRVLWMICGGASTPAAVTTLPRGGNLRAGADHDFAVARADLGGPAAPPDTPTPTATATATATWHSNRNGHRDPHGDADGAPTTTATATATATGTIPAPQRKAPGSRSSCGDLSHPLRLLPRETSRGCRGTQSAVWYNSR